MNQIFFTFLFLVSSFSTSAQLNYGIKTGLNLSQMGTDKKEYTGIRWNAGIFAEYYYPSNWGTQVGLAYSKKGSSYIEGVHMNPDKDSPTGMHKTSLNYFTIPLEIRYRLHVDEKVYLTVGAGGYWSYGLNGYSYIQYTSGGYAWDPFKKEMIIWNEQEINVESIKKGDYGSIFSLEASFKHIFIGVNYELGLANLGKLPINTGRFPHNRTWNICIGYKFK